MKILTLAELGTTEPITLIEAKLYCRITSSFEDGLITTMIKSARQACERYCRMNICKKRLRVDYRIPKIDSDGLTYTQIKDPDSVNFSAILVNGPVIDVETVKLILRNGSEQILDPSTYSVDKDGGRLRWVENAQLIDYWVNNHDIDMLQITYTVGFEDPYTTLPSGVKDAILATLMSLYERDTDAFALPKVAQMLLTEYYNTYKYYAS